jgi:uncharacterized membrane protein YhaH (DUF805 family)
VGSGRLASGRLRHGRGKSLRNGRFCTMLSASPSRAYTRQEPAVDLMTAVKTVLAKYADFSGRARRSEYWYFFLAVFLGYIVAIILISIAKPFFFLAVIYYLGIIVPGLAVGVRRMHDTGKSGWFLLIPIYSLVLAVTDSDAADNQYGPNPKGAAGLPPVGYGMPPVA